LQKKKMKHKKNLKKNYIKIKKIPSEKKKENLHQK